MKRAMTFLAVIGMTSSFAVNAQQRRDRDRDRRVDGPVSAMLDHFDDVQYRTARAARFLSPEQIANVKMKLDDILGIIDSRSGGSLSQLRCVSKDNDGRDPWMIAVARDPVTNVKINGTVTQTNAQCQALIASIEITGRDQGIVCVSKDNDGRDPWVLSQLSFSSASVRAVPNSVASTQAACNRQYRDSRESPSGTYFCGTKDNDGRAPFLVVLMRPDGTVSTGSETFSTYDHCVRSLQ